MFKCVWTMNNCLACCTTRSIWWECVVEIFPAVTPVVELSDELFIFFSQWINQDWCTEVDCSSEVDDSPVDSTRSMPKTCTFLLFPYRLLIAHGNASEIDFETAYWLTAWSGNCFPSSSCISENLTFFVWGPSVGDSWNTLTWIKSDLWEQYSLLLLLSYLTHHSTYCESWDVILTVTVMCS